MTAKVFFVMATLTVTTAAATDAQSTDQTGQTDGVTVVRPTSSLDASIDLFGSIDRAFNTDTNVLTPSGSGLAALTADQNSFGGNSSLVYVKTSRSLDVDANLGASVRRIPLLRAGLLPSYNGSVTLDGPLSRRTRWNATQSMTYGATNAAAFFASAGSVDGSGAPSVPLVDYRLANQDQFGLESRGGLSYRLSRRGTLSGSAGFARSSAVGSFIQAPGVVEIPRPPGTDGLEGETGNGVNPITSGDGSFRRWDAAGRYTYQWTRYLNVYAGYGIAENSLFQDQGSAVGRSPRLHSIDSGVGYGRPLSFSRRTRISGQIGSSSIQQRGRQGQEWLATGNAQLTHEFGRTWQTQLIYVRDTRFVPAFIDPVVSGGVTASVGGNLSRRATLLALANHSSGRIGVDTGSNGYRMSTGSVRYRYAFLTSMAVYAEYFLFDFKFDSGVQLVDSLFNEARRHGVRFGVSIGTGLAGNRRRTPAVTEEGTR